MKSKNNLWVPILGAILLVLTVLINYLSDYFRLGGYTNKEVSDMYPTLFTPAPITFSIWGIIYLSLIIFSILSFKKNNEELIKDIGPFYILSFVLNIAWIITWHFNVIGVSLFIIFLLMMTLFIIQSRCADNNKEIGHAIFGIYSGWITVATIASIFTVLTKEIGRFHESKLEILLAVAMIIIATMVTWYMTVLDRNPFYGVSVFWGMLGIVINQFDMYNGKYDLVISAAVVSMIIILISIGIDIRDCRKCFKRVLN